ncbi:TraX family protein [Marinilactibacillus sp. Marseille-P9653]|uniref:TraX family protein n=1 Tax=Marinilactibacillus sp. Marseille-P9653 TaxID=2866583 RepID=UPI001CE49BAA|nr:TraX family protein [Marinilactibacillus sp. Marseille-P9653]
MKAIKTLVHLKEVGLNANLLKILAVTAMLVDHGFRLFTEEGTQERWWVHLFGRLAMPIICYLVAESHHYTTNKKRYMWRIFLFAIISHIPYVAYFNLSYFRATSVMWTILLGVIGLEIVKNEKVHTIYKILGIALCCLLAVPANWHYVGVLWIVSFGIFRDNFSKKVIAFAIIGILLYIYPGLQDLGMQATYRFGQLLVIPILYLYNGQPGKRNKFSRWAFYWFYPMHLVLLLGIRYFFF